MSTKATPGPWTHQRRMNSDYGREVMADNGRRIVCETICAEHEGNAALISAAPELLEALLKALPFIEDWTLIQDNGYKNGCIEKVLKEINAAIAKAEGAK